MTDVTNISKQAGCVIQNLGHKYNKLLQSAQLVHSRES